MQENPFLLQGRRGGTGIFLKSWQKLFPLKQIRGFFLMALLAASEEDGASRTRPPTMASAREREVRGFAIFMLLSLILIFITEVCD